MSLNDAQRYSPFHNLPKRKVPTILAYGARELPEFIKNSKNYAQLLNNIGCNVKLIEVADANHFDMINELANLKGQLFLNVIEMIFNKSKL